MKIITVRNTLFLGLSLFFSLFTQSSASAQWVKQNTPAMKGLYTMQAIGKNTMWTANQNLGGLDSAHVTQFIRTSDGGTTYKLGTVFTTDDYYYHIQAYDSKTAYLLAGLHSGQPPFLFRRTVDSGLTWQNMPYAPTTFPGLIHFYDANNGVYVGDPDSLGFFAAYTTNGGNTFTRIPQSNLPQPMAEEFTNLGKFQVLGDILFLETYVFNSETGDLNWRIMRSIDRGRNWTAGAFFTTGVVFEARFCFTDANNGMVLRGIGTIDMKSPLYTIDGGATWQESSKYPGLVSFPIDNIPNTQTMMAIFQDTVSKVTFTAATNDLGKTWNSRKDIGPSILDRRYADILGLEYYINGQLEIVDNNIAWAQFSNTAIHRYDNSTPLVPEIPDLDLQLNADNDGLPLYGYVKYTLTLTNRGIAPATGVKVNWLPPYKRTSNGSGPYAFVGAYSDKGRYDSWNGIWSLDKLDAGATATANIHLFVLDNSKPITQTAQVTACNERDIDSSPNNMSGAAKEDDEIGFVAQSNFVDVPKSNIETEQPEVIVSPNPAKDKLGITVNPAKDFEWLVQVLNSLGQAVFSQKGQYAQRLDIDVKSLDNGLYFVEYLSNGERKVEKVLVQH